jgi:hypothetical protein
MDRSPRINAPQPTHTSADRRWWNPLDLSCNQFSDGASELGILDRGSKVWGPTLRGWISG